MGVELTLEIQTTIQGQFMRMHRSVDLLAVPLPGDRHTKCPNPRQESLAPTAPSRGSQATRNPGADRTQSLSDSARPEGELAQDNGKFRAGRSAVSSRPRIAVTRSSGSPTGRGPAQLACAAPLVRSQTTVYGANRDRTGDRRALCPGVPRTLAHHHHRALHACQGTARGSRTGQPRVRAQADGQSRVIAVRSAMSPGDEWR